jgi:hypothetical protein
MLLLSLYVIHYATTAPAAGTALPSATLATSADAADSNTTAGATATAVDDCTTAAPTTAVADCAACKRCAAVSTRKGRGTEVLYNVDTLCHYLLHTGDFCEPTTRLPFTLAQVVELEELAGRAGTHT